MWTAKTAFWTASRRDRSTALAMRDRRPWSRASLDFEDVISSSSLLTLATRASTMVEVSLWSFPLASFWRMARVRERHWDIISGEVACGR